MNILVTGGTGFVGINLISALIKGKHNVRILSRNREKATKLFGESFDVFIGDVTDRDSLKGCCKDVDVVYHMAAKVGNELPSNKEFIEFRKVNVKGVQNIVDECKEACVKKFILISSIAAMGIIQNVIINESSDCKPDLPYQVTKLEGEMVVIKEFLDNKFPGIIVRPTKVYGPGENEMTYLMLAKLCKKGFFFKVGIGNNYQSNVYISDLIQGLVQLIDRGEFGEVYILSSESSIAFCEIANIIGMLFKNRIKFIFIPVWLMALMANIIEKTFLLLHKKPPVTKRNIQAIVTDRVYDISKAKNEIGYKPDISMQQGIINTINWYIKKGLI